jgi:hypothetical protein
MILHLDMNYLIKLLKYSLSFFIYKNTEDFNRKSIKLFNIE